MFAILVALICIVVASGVLLVRSPGKPRILLSSNGEPIANSVSEKVYVNINGVEQGMFIKSKDATHPVLLFLHGGMPVYFLSEKYPTGIEDHFTIVWWERRGSGMSYSADIPAETMTLEQLIADTVTVTKYLCERFGKEKIYLMGHSGGTFIGIQTAARAPELYHAYIGVSQMSNQLESEKLAYDFMLAQYKQQRNSKMVRKLEAAPVTRKDGTPAAYLALRDVAMHDLGVGTMRQMNSVITGVFLASLMSRDYTFAEKVHMWLGKSRAGVSMLWDEMLATDLSTQVRKLAVPTYFLHGRHDYTTSYALAKSYCERIEAPLKGFYSFEESAHSPLFEEPEKMQRILFEDVLAGSNRLADAN